MHLALTSWLVFLFVLSPHFSFAQSAKFVSELDQNLAIKTVTIMPVPDNVSGIYSRPINENAQAMVEFDKQWNYKPWPADMKYTPEQMDENPALVTQALKKAGADALVAGRVSKGSSGITFKLSIFSGKEGLPLVTETHSNYEGYETKDIMEQFQNVFRRAKSRIPYAGEVLSRKGQLVTLNIGAASGIRSGQDLTAVQILKIDRHPKSKFLVNSDLVIMGKIHIEKADEYLSFGSVVNEREANVIGPGSFIRREEFVVYPQYGSPMGARPESDAVLGQDPKPWEPEANPSLGRVMFMGGIGTYNMTNTTTSGDVTGRSTLTPSIHLLGEMWFDPKWFAGVELHQYVVRVDNNLRGSSPAALNVSTLESNLQLGYNFLVQDTFWGPKFQIAGGFSKMSTFVDQSNPTAFNSMQFSGWTLGLGGSFPIETESHNMFSVGGKLIYYFINTSVSESPKSSGAAKAQQATSFAATGEYRMSPRLGLCGQMIFSLYGANFNGEGDRSPPATSASHQMTTLAFGIDYLF